MHKIFFCASSTTLNQTGPRDQYKKLEEKKTLISSASRRPGAGINSERTETSFLTFHHKTTIRAGDKHAGVTTAFERLQAVAATCSSKCQAGPAAQAPLIRSHRPPSVRLRIQPPFRRHKGASPRTRLGSTDQSGASSRFTRLVAGYRPVWGLAAQPPGSRCRLLIQQ